MTGVGEVEVHLAQAQDLLLFSITFHHHILSSSQRDPSTAQTHTSIVHTAPTRVKRDPESPKRKEDVPGHLPTMSTAGPSGQDPHYDFNLRSMQRTDPSIVEILESAAYGTIYHYRILGSAQEPEWVKERKEGPIFIVRRCVISPVACRGQRRFADDLELQSLTSRYTS